MTTPTSGSAALRLALIAVAVTGACQGNIGGGTGPGAGGGGPGGSGGGTGGRGGGAGVGSGGVDGMVAPPTCTSDTPAPVRIWRLTATQYDNTLADVLRDDSRPGQGFIVGANSGGYLNDAESGIVTRQVVEGYRTAAKAAAKTAVARNLAMLLPCTPADPADEVCVGKLISEFGRRAYRAAIDAALIKIMGADPAAWGKAA